jgi:hypothetical protein
MNNKRKMKDQIKMFEAKKVRTVWDAGEAKNNKSLKRKE